MAGNERKLQAEEAITEDKDQLEEREKISESYRTLSLQLDKPHAVGREAGRHSEPTDRPSDIERSLHDVQEKLKAHLREKFTLICEGTSASKSRLENIYTRLYITQQTEAYAYKQHEILDQFNIPDERSAQVVPDYEKINPLNIFNPRRNTPQQQDAKYRSIHSVMTKGIAGIGKTVAVQNFSLNWAEGKSNQHIEFMFVLPFRELNMVKVGEYSLLQLLLHFYPELKLLKDPQQLGNRQVLIILDGLDESRFALDFDGGQRVSEIDQKSTVQVLLTNLIKGNLLPNALLWVTSRPAAVSQIPSKYIDQMTEVQGFNNQQKEDYFRKRFRGQANEVMSCLRGMISFYLMGHIPIFCWITAEVYKGWSDQRSQKMTTMTELYIYYLLIQTQRTTQKYGEKISKETSKSENAAVSLNLSKLAFEQLQKGNLIFYEEDLRECDINVDDTSVFCGFCSEILKQERGLYQKKMFSFVHLSFQEFLAALYMFHCCVTKNSSTLKSFLGVDPTDLDLLELQKRVVDKALQCEKGQLDLFLCFFLGLSLDSSQTLLQGLLPQTKSCSDTVEAMKRYLRNFNAGNIPAERCMNLFLCKFELKEESFQNDISMYLTSGVRLSPIDCAVLSTLLQISGEQLEELDLTKCITPFMGTWKLVVQMKNCKKAVLKSEHLDGHCLDTLLSILQSADSCLQELCLVCFSNAIVPVPDTVFALLANPHCKLRTLRLSGFALSSKNCHTLASILQSKQSPLRVLDLTDCIYGYPRDYSGYFLKEGEKKKKYEEVNDELSLLTIIASALIGPVCKLEEFSMRGCYLKSKCCQVFATILSSNSQLRTLDLSRNDLKDLGVHLFCAGLASAKCRVEILRLSSCGITAEGCASLASALRCSPSHLRELDLSYNYPGETGVKLLSERLDDPQCRLEKLNMDHNEEHWANPHLLHEYACDLTLDPNTVNEHLLLSECNRKVIHTKEKQPYPDHPDRFDEERQVLCREGLTGRCYWEVEWEGCVNIGVVYKSLERKGLLDANIIRSDKAWCYSVTGWDGYSFYDGHKETLIPVPIIDVQAFLARSRRLGLFLDWPSGILSFYWLSGDTKILLHTFHTTFIEPLYPVFTVFFGSSLALTSVVRQDINAAHSSFTPEVKTKRTGISYRFRFPSSGVFQCSLTGLVFNVTHEGEVVYNTKPWDDTVLQLAGKLPGGPLFSITCPQGSICQLQLPHCEPYPALVSESLSVVHITNDGMSIVQPLEITDTHVVIDIPHLSHFGIVRDMFKKIVTTPVNGQVLLFLRPTYREHLILSVILLPSNVPLQEVKAQHDNSEYIQAPSLCQLHIDKHYSLHSDPESYRIQPPHAHFFKNFGPNYHASFEITLTTSTEEVTLMVQDPDGTQVWQHCLYLPASPPHPRPDETQPQMGNKVSAEKKLQGARSSFVERVSDPVLNKLLDDLQQYRVITDAEGEEARIKSRQDKARDVIDMVRKKGEEASSIMITILNNNDPFLCKGLHLN
ncbi:NACHT, LRR and PYD domains-containing protein 12-like isoform X1 [Channa argus]|uniref:NACHT, LRR and PYD domains-containing protein 12-like isoform X1 n=2 Tax=Channa argus TaxID=215402 RepID=UPI0029466E6E|nr:hypothetical protein Q8A73_003881 [Channa argus]